MAIHSVSPEFEEATYKKVSGRLIPFLFICYIIAFLTEFGILLMIRSSGVLK